MNVSLFPVRSHVIRGRQRPWGSARGSGGVSAKISTKLDLSVDNKQAIHRKQAGGQSKQPVKSKDIVNIATETYSKLPVLRLPQKDLAELNWDIILVLVKVKWDLFGIAKNLRLLHTKRIRRYLRAEPSYFTGRCHRASLCKSTSSSASVCYSNVILLKYNKTAGFTLKVLET